jgi:hypothetical protein
MRRNPVVQWGQGHHQYPAQTRLTCSSRYHMVHVSFLRWTRSQGVFRVLTPRSFMVLLVLLAIHQLIPQGMAGQRWGGIVILVLLQRILFQIFAACAEG